MGTELFIQIAIYTCIYLLGLILVHSKDWSSNYPFWSNEGVKIPLWFIYLPIYLIRDICRRTLHRSRWIRQLLYWRMYHDLVEKKMSLKSNQPYGYCWSIDCCVAWYMSAAIKDYPELMNIMPAEEHRFGLYNHWWFDPFDRDIRMRKLLEIINAYR